VKYRENMTADELVQFKKDLNDLDNAYKSAAEHDAKAAMSPAPMNGKTQATMLAWAGLIAGADHEKTLSGPLW
jgi:hypothetical protein